MCRCPFVVIVSQSVVVRSSLYLGLSVSRKCRALCPLVDPSSFCSSAEGYWEAAFFVIKAFEFVTWGSMLVFNLFALSTN